MALKEQIHDDILGVFLNTDDFAEEHVVNGITLRCVVDDDRLLERSDKQAQGVYLGEKLLFVNAGDLPGKPAVGGPLELDGRVYYVNGCIESMGMYEIRIGANMT